MPTLFNKELSKDSKDELAELYAKREPHANVVRELRGFINDLEEHMATRRRFENSYDELEFHQFMRGYEEELFEAKNKLAQSEDKNKLRMIDENIADIERREYGTDKISLLNQLEVLYETHPYLVTRYDSLTKKAVKIEESMQQTAAFEDSYDPVEYQASMTMMKGLLAEENIKIEQAEDIKKLKQVEDDIVRIEKEVFGEVKLESPRFVNAPAAAKS